LYDVDWVLGGRLNGCEREDLVYRTADDEGMTDSTDHRRQKQKPVNLMEEVARMDALKKESRQKQQQKMKEKQQKAKLNCSKIGKTSKEVNGELVQNTKAKSDKKLKSTTYTTECDIEQGPKRGIKRKNLTKSSPVHTDDEKMNATSLELFERQMREFNRFFARLRDKVDLYRHFWSNGNQARGNDTNSHLQVAHNAISYDSTGDLRAESKTKIYEYSFRPKNADNSEISPTSPPENWEELMNRVNNGRYIIDREFEEEELRFTVLNEYYQMLPAELRPLRTFPVPRSPVPIAEIDSLLNSRKGANSRVSQAFGINWGLFRNDIVDMCNAALEHMEPDEDDCGQRGTISNSVRKVKESLDQFYERTCQRHANEMITADGRHKFSRAIESYSNKEAAMQTWRKDPFPERRYERITCDAVCDGLSKVDERIATYELRTNLPNSFIGQSYHYNDIGLSEVWMKSVVDETETIRGNKKSKLDQNREAALALAADEGVRRAQVNATMQALLIGVQDRVMTDLNVLHQCELTSENWQSEEIKQHSFDFSTSNLMTGTNDKKIISSRPGNEQIVRTRRQDQSTNPKTHTTIDRPPQIVEKPVWGLDCYTRRNIMVCLEVEFEDTVALSFIEKWLLPAINACPEILAQNIANAARILEGLPFDSDTLLDLENCTISPSKLDVPTWEEWGKSFLGRALLTKIRNSGPPWLKYAAQQLRIARAALGESFFLVHPKGNGSVLLMDKVEANRLVTFYHGELYPSWRWGEKMEAIEMTQQRKDLKP
jgi:[histone H3]-lysine4 N-trimethyltransferase ATXR3